MTPSGSDTIWTRTFALLCLAQVFGYAQHFMLQPALPLYVTQLGGTPFTVGLVLASFAVTSVTVRPLSYGVGGLLAGGAVDLFGFTWMYLIMAGLSAVGLIVTLANWSKIG
jgi:MFS family permease